MAATHYAEPAEQRRSAASWWARNWFWLLPIGCLGSILIIVAFVAGILMFVWGMMTSSGAYQEALARAQADPRVIAALGEPIEPGRFLTGSIRYSGSTGYARLSIPISGPLGEARIELLADSTNDVWTFSKLEVILLDTADRIDLLAPP